MKQDRNPNIHPNSKTEYPYSYQKMPDIAKRYSKSTTAAPQQSYIPQNNTKIPMVQETAITKGSPYKYSQRQEYDRVNQKAEIAQKPTSSWSPLSLGFTKQQMPSKKESSNIRKSNKIVSTPKVEQPSSKIQDQYSNYNKNQYTYTSKPNTMSCGQCCHCLASCCCCCCGNCLLYTLTS